MGDNIPPIPHRSVTQGNPIEKCMEKMLSRDVRHLFIRDKGTSEIIGIISARDIVSCAREKSLAQISHLEKLIETRKNPRENFD